MSSRFTRLLRSRIYAPTANDQRRTKKKNFRFVRTVRTDGFFHAEEIDENLLRYRFSPRSFDKILKKILEAREKRCFIDRRSFRKRRLRIYIYIYSAWHEIHEIKILTSLPVAGRIERGGHRIESNRVRVGERIHTDKVHRRRQAKRRSAGNEFTVEHSTYLQPWQRL